MMFMMIIPFCELIFRMRNELLMPSPISCSAISIIIEIKMEDIFDAIEGDVDPAAEFLAREQSELEELGIEDQVGVSEV